MTSDEKTSLAEIVAGDEVAYRPYGGFRGRVLQRQKVDRVTTTQIILFGNQRFRRQDGERIGQLFRSDTIYALGAQLERWDKTVHDVAKDQAFTYAQLVEKEQADEQDRQRRQELADWIHDRLAKMGDVTTEQLEQAAKLLGYESA